MVLTADMRRSVVMAAVGCCKRLKRRGILLGGWMDASLEVITRKSETCPEIADLLQYARCSPLDIS